MSWNWSGSGFLALAWFGVYCLAKASFISPVNTAELRYLVFLVPVSSEVRGLLDGDTVSSSSADSFYTLL